MLALITGASGGIGKDMADILAKQGYDLILVARSLDKLNRLKESLNTKVEVISLDLSHEQSCYELYEKTKDKGIDILINNAGYGLFGEFTKTSLDDEINMLDLNIKSVHILTKLFLKDFVKRDSGYIMNVSSLAAFLAGPLLSSYYASKSYVLKLTQAINEELRHNKSNVHICALCPGPVDTGFNDRAGVKFAIKALNSYNVANYALKKMFKRKLVILPSLSNRALAFGIRFVPTRLMLLACYYIQKSKEQKGDNTK